MLTAADGAPLDATRYQRLEKLKDLRWETGTIIPETLAPKCVASCCAVDAMRWKTHDADGFCANESLSQREVQFFHGYDQILTDYMSSFELDLSAVRFLAASTEVLLAFLLPYLTPRAGYATAQGSVRGGARAARLR